MDLLRAVSNPAPYESLDRLVALKRQLLQKAPSPQPPSNRPAARAGELVRTIVEVLTESARPMRVQEIGEAAEHRLGRPVNRRSVKGVSLRMCSALNAEIQANQAGRLSIGVTDYETGGN
jgi:hypothetical protein